MKKMIFFEWLHFRRNAARPIAVFLFLLAAIFGLYNGANTYQDRLQQIDSINLQTAETQSMVKGWFDSEESGPKDRPWVNISTPFWSMWYATHYVIQEPNPGMTYNIGQSEHFGYYKRVSMWSTAFDDDLTAEIANPELIQLGALDFTFVWLYLMPLLLIILTYQIKGLEHDLGFIPILKNQIYGINKWVLQRIILVGLLLVVLLVLLVFLPALFQSTISLNKELLHLWVIYFIYLVFWLVIISLIATSGKGQADHALKMIGVWLLLTVGIPGIINQYILLNKPADLMMSMIEASRDGQSEIYDREEHEIIDQAYQLLPSLKDTKPAKQDSLMNQTMINGAYRLVLNEYMGEISADIIKNQQERNQLIEATYIFNPITAFHNWLNNITETGHEANLKFRMRIKESGDIINEQLILDEWNDKAMNKEQFNEYVKLLN